MASGAGRAAVASGAAPAGRAVRWVPSPLRDPLQRWPLLSWLGVGLAIRLAVMPFTVTYDMLATYWRAHVIAYQGEVFGGYLVNMGAHYLHALSLRLLDPLLPPAAELWTDPWWWGDAEALAPQVLRGFAEQPDAFQTLFVLKLPYLAADLAAGLLLLAVVAACRPEAVRRAWAFWMLSPIGLYAAFLFGRYEPFAVVFVVAALLLVERDRPWLGALLLGVAITMRTYPLLLVPVFALVAVTGLRRQVAWGALALVPFALISASNQLLAGTVGELARLQDAPTGATLFAYTLPTDGVPLYVFFLAVLLLYGALAGRALGWWGTGPVAPSELWLWVFAVHALLFALARSSPHYLAWLTPFVALAIARRPEWRGVLWLHLAQAAAALLLADVQGWGVAVFAPAVPGLDGPAGAVVTPPIAGERLDGLLLTGFTAATLLLVWPLFRELRTGRSPAAGPPPQASARPPAATASPS